MIIKKKRINSLSCLNHVEEGKNLMMVLRDAARFKGILVKLGFSEELIEGERVTIHVKSDAEEKCRAFLY